MATSAREAAGVQPGAHGRRRRRRWRREGCHVQLAATSSTLDDDIGAGCHRVARRPFTSPNSAQDDRGGAEAAGMSTGVSSLPSAKLVVSLN
jgi:hypothetical protein